MGGGGGRAVSVEPGFCLDLPFTCGACLAWLSRPHPDGQQVASVVGWQAAEDRQRVWCSVHWRIGRVTGSV